MPANTWAPGPQQLSQVEVNDGAATVVSADLIENYSVDETEKESYTSAKGITIDRGFATRTGSFDVLDYAAVANLEGMMVDRDLTTITSTFGDSVTEAIANASVSVTPLVNLVPDACNIYIAAQGTGNTSISANWTNLGVTIEQPDFTFEFPFDVEDGCGRNLFGKQVLAEITIQLPGLRGANTDVYAAAYAFEGLNADLAIAMPNGKFIVFKDMYSFVSYGAEDTTGVRTVSLRVTGVANKWSDMIEYTDGSATPNTTAWGVTTASQGPGNKFSGCTVSFTGTAVVEDDGAGNGVVDWTTP